MRYLPDTNIVLRLASEDTEKHALVKQALRQVAEQGDEIVLVPQVLYEFWGVGTRPQPVNGFGWGVERARLEVEELLLQFPLLPDTPLVFTTWLELVTTHQVSGKQVHDARLAAAALAHGLEVLLTLNGDDFKRFEVRTVHPRDVSA